MMQGASSNLFARARTVLLALAGVALAAGPSLAQSDGEADAYSAEVEQRTRSLVDALTANANDETLSEEARDENYRGILEGQMNVAVVADEIFGEELEALASEEQAAAFMELMPDYVAANFADQIGRLADRTIEITEVRPHPRNPDSVRVVRSRLLDDSGRERARIDWLWVQRDGTTGLVDVFADGVGKVLTERDTFVSRAQREGMDSLLDFMRGYIAERMAGDA